jgi:hypothetical protein
MNERRYLQMRYHISLLVTASLLVLGCATQPTPSTPPATVPTAAATLTPTPVATPPSPAAESQDVATVIIYRPKSFIGMALRPTVMLDGKDLANITNGRYYKGRFAPGRYLFQMDDKKSGAGLDLVAGETYYFKVEIVPGFWKGGGKMTLMAKEQGDYEITQLAPIDAHEVLNKRFN